MNKDIRINERIRAREVRLIDSDGKQVGVMPLNEALRIAREKDLDLVEVAPNANPPVCKIMDFGKYKYQLSKKQTTKKTMNVKEIKIRPHINEHDLQLKVKHIRRFLDDGNMAKITMFLRGRERVMPELGMRVFKRLEELLTGKFNVVQTPKFEGNHITMVISPK